MKETAPQPDVLKNRSNLLAAGAFVAIALAAVAVRFWALASQPAGLYPDEAAEGVSAQRILTEPGYHPVFFDDDGGREALYGYVVALSFRLFGSSVLVLRSTTAALGVLAVIAVWLGVRRFGRWPALTAMGWAAGSLWLICVSRDGLRNIMTVAFGALALAALVRWGDRPGRFWAVVAGLAAGAGLWIYQPLKFTPLLVLGWILWMHHRDRERYRRVRAGLGWAALAYVVVAAPMLWTAITDFNNYFARGASVSVFYAGSASADSYPIHILKTFGMFLVNGDPNQRHDVGALPAVGPVLFVPFALGIWRAWRMREDHGHAALLIGFAVFLIPPLVANEGGAPHFLRTLGLAPFVAAFIGIGCLELQRLVVAAARRARGSRPRLVRWVVPAAVVAALAALGVLSIVTYLARPVSDRYEAYSFADVQLAAAADRGPGTVIVIDSYDAYDVRFLDAANLPLILDPGTHLRNPSVYSLIVAGTRSDIAAATDAATAALAVPIGTTPQGQPVGWEVVP